MCYTATTIRLRTAMVMKKNEPCAFEDLRAFIEYLDAHGELVKIAKAVSTKYEAATIQVKVCKQLNKAVLFTNLDNKGQRLLGNTYISRKMIAYMFGVEPQDLVQKVTSFRNAPRLSVNLVDTAACQEVVHESFNDIREVVPIPWNYEKDASYFITAGLVVTKDPENGKVNPSICRMMYRGGNLLNVFFAPMQHNWMIFNKYKELKRDMPIAVIIGADPYVMFASESGIPYEEDEFEYAGTMKGKPIEMVHCKTVDHYVPANAEFILEGVVSYKDTSLEGPMGENQRIYGPQSGQPTVTISCITHRQDPIYQNILGGTVEEHSLLAVPMEARILQMLRAISPRVITLNLLPNFMRCVIQIDDYPAVQRGLAKNVLLSALSEPWIKYAIIVDKDVDIDDPHEVNWAIMTRANMADDLVLVKDAWGFVMDPSRKSKEEPVTKIGIDATVDPADRDRCLKTDVHEYAACDLREYLTELQ